MRVVAGQAKGRKLKSPKTISTRPIMDRVKTALFDILAVRIKGARFLDLFAGTGSVGIEALSRGAAHATFIEMNMSMLKLVRENLQITGLAAHAETIYTDAFKFLQASPLAPTPMTPTRSVTTFHTARTPGQEGNSRREYDIIYVAPPQYQGLAARALGLLDSSPLVAEDGLVIVQIHPKERPGVVQVLLTRLVLADERRYGSTLLMFFEVKREEQSTDVDITTEA
jgi:16S rRNA (guanine966-N2)-methyltransferase